MDLEQKCVSKQMDITHSTLKNLRAQKSTCDVELICDDLEVLPAHQLILRAGSKYFEAMFSSGMKEASSNRVELPTINRESMELVLDFIYLQRVNASNLLDIELTDLLSAAHLLEINPLVEICVGELCKMVTDSNWPTMLQIAHKYSVNDLMSAVVQHFACCKCNEDEARDALVAENVECFNAFISSSSSEKCLSDNTLVDLILCWASYDKADRKSHLTRLFSHIDFNAVSRSVVTNLISENDLFTENADLAYCLLQKLFPNSAQRSDFYTAASKPKLLIFKYNALHSYEIVRKEWSAHHRLMDNFIPEPYSPIAVSSDVIYFVTQFKSACCYDSYHNPKKDSDMHIVEFYPQFGCGNVITKYPQKTKFGMVGLNNVLYLMGGVYNNSSSKKTYFECFDLKTKQWQCLAEPSLHRLYPRIVTLYNKLYVFGGRTSDSSGLIQDVDMYWPRTNQCTTVTRIPECATFTVAPCGPRIYLGARIGSQNFQSILFEYNVVKNSWTSVKIENMRLCGSSKPLNYLIFEQADKYCRMNLLTKKCVAIMQKKGSIIEGENVESGNVIIFA